MANVEDALRWIMPIILRGSIMLTELPIVGRVPEQSDQWRRCQNCHLVERGLHSLQPHPYLPPLTHRLLPRAKIYSQLTLDMCNNWGLLWLVVRALD